eukprot:6198023-Pleurochrysis_carterae.AAC.5
MCSFSFLAKPRSAVRYPFCLSLRLFSPAAAGSVACVAVCALLRLCADKSVLTPEQMCWGFRMDAVTAGVGVGHKVKCARDKRAKRTWVTKRWTPSTLYGSADDLMRCKCYELLERIVIFI